MFNNLKEIFEDSKCYIYELATSTNKMKEKVQYLSHPIFTHILKIAYLNKLHPQTLEHWSGEIMNWILQCFSLRLKTTNKYPSKEQVYNWLFEDFIDEESLNIEYILINDEYKVKIDRKNSLLLIKKVIEKLLILRETMELDKQTIITAILSHIELIK